MGTRLSAFCDKVIEAGWLAAVIVAPLFFNIYSSRVFEPDKITLVRSIASVMAVAWVIKVLDGAFQEEEGEEGTETRGREQGEEEALVNLWKRVKAVPLMLPTLALVAIYLLSTVASVVPGISLWGSYQRLQGTYTTFSYIVIFFMILQGMRTREQIDRLVTVVILVSMPISLYGLIQHARLDPLPWGGDVTRRVASNMGNSIFIAAYLIMAIPLTIGRLIKALASIVEGEETAKKMVFVIVYPVLLVAQMFVWGRFEFKPGLWTGLGLLIVLPFFSLLIRKPVAHFLLLGCYSFILAAQVICTFFSQSRGPWLGLLGGIYVFVLLSLISLRREAEDQSPLSWQEAAQAVAFALTSPLALLVVPYAILIVLKKGVRWLWFSWLIQALVGIAFLVVFNLPSTPLEALEDIETSYYFSSPLETLRELPYVGRLGQVFQTTRGTGRVRILIWEGALNLVAPHAPIEYPSGQPDPRNILRPLIGYGPESMYVAYNRFYPPDLAHVEARNASPDRSHNETFDALVITGFLGFLVYMFLFGSVFYYGLKWLGLIGDVLQRNVYIALWLGGAFLGALGSWFLDGTLRFVGVGIPTGIILGLAVYVGLYGFIFYSQDQRVEDKGYRVLLITLLGALVAHFIEIHFGIAIAATRTYFWAYTALMVIVGQYFREEPALMSSTEALPPAQKPSGRRKKRRRRKDKEDGARFGHPGLGPTSAGTVSKGWTASLVVSSLITGLILVTMRFDYITAQFDIKAKDYSIFWLFAATWLLALVIIVTELSKDKAFGQSEADWVMALVTYPLISLGCFTLFSTVHSRQLHVGFSVTNLEQALKVAGKVAGVLIPYYLALFLFILITAGALLRRTDLPPRSWRYGNWWLYPPLLVGVVWVVATMNLKVIMADIYYKQASPYEGAGQWDSSIAMYRQALNLAPNEDFYFLFMGRAALEKAQRLPDNPADASLRLTLGTLLRPTPIEQQQLANAGRGVWLALSEIALRRALELNPLNTDHSANLGRLYRTRGGLTTDRAQRFAELSQSADYYRQATSLSPHNAQLFNEWGSVYYLMGQYDKALEKYQRSLSLDPLFADTYVYLGDVYQALNQPDKALEAHLRAIELDPGSLSAQRLFSLPIPGFLESRLRFYINSGQIDRLIAALDQSPGHDFSIRYTVGNAYLQQGKQDKALEEFLKAVEIKPDDLNSHVAIGYIYAQQGRLDEAVREFQRSVEIAPNDLVSHRNLGGVYRQQGRLEEARAEFERAVAIAPDDLITHQNLAEVYRQLGMKEEALREFQRCVEIAPGDFNSHKNLAIFYQELGRIDEAIAEAQSAKELASEDQRPAVEGFILQLQQQKGGGGE
ncbi:MAG: tetratricopeptide repeat protein [Anaerolineae bacterium]